MGKPVGRFNNALMRSLSFPVQQLLIWLQIMFEKGTAAARLLVMRGLMSIISLANLNIAKKYPDEETLRKENKPNQSTSSSLFKTKAL